ncbi:MAG: hypothetical protein HKN36_04790 [Hellea sp.]|nr:hypothetical protein [Hellea sp.]
MTDERDRTNSGASEPLRPILSRPRSKKVQPDDYYSKLVFIISLLLAGLAIIASAFGFAGFAENDQNIGHLISSFILCFGVGALAYVPLGFTAYYAQKAMKTPLPRLRAIIVMAFVVPWFPLGFFLIILGGNMRVLGIVALLAAALIGLWALRYLKD